MNAVRGGAVLDGTEIAALLISKRSHLLRVGDVILLFNIALFLAAMSARRRAGAVFDPHLRVRGPDARLRHLRARGVHGHHDRLGAEQGDSRADHRRARARRHSPGTAG